MKSQILTGFDKFLKVVKSVLTLIRICKGFHKKQAACFFSVWHRKGHFASHTCFGLIIFFEIPYSNTAVRIPLSGFTCTGRVRSGIFAGPEITLPS